MTRERIEELANLRKEELSKSYEKDYRYDYCKDYLDNHDVSKVDDYADIDIFAYMKCAFYFNGTSWSIEDISDKFESFKVFLEISDVAQLRDFVNMTLSVDDAGNIDNVINFLEGHQFMKSVFGLSEMIEEDFSYLRIMKDLKKVNNCKDVNLADFFKCYKEQGVDFLQIIVDYVIYRTMLIKAEIIKNRSEEMNLRGKEKNQLLKKEYKDNFAVSELFKDMAKIRNFVNEEEKKERQFVKNNNKEIFNINAALALLDNELEKEEITNAKEIVSKIKDLELKYAILELISEHNQKYYEVLNQEYEHLNKNNKVKYQALLNDYGITNGSQQIERIMNNSLEDVEAILKIITKFGLTTEQTLRILRNSNLEIVSQIKEYLERGYLSVEFIVNNIDIFYKNSTKYQDYNRSLEILNSYNINPSIFFYSIKILFGNTELLKKNLDILNNYYLLNSLKTTSDYSFLEDEELVLKIDKLIELGYEDYLEEDLNLLNSDKLLRLEALKSFEVEITSKEELDKVLTKRFYIDDEELIDYIPNNIDLDDKIDLEDIKLDEYRNSSRTYNINGTLVSANKVSRLLYRGDSKYNAIFSGMRLNKEEYDGIIECLKGNTYHK